MPRGVTTSRAHNKVSARTFVCDAGQMYGAVSAAQGNGRFLVTCDDGVERQCKVRGAMRRREWVNKDDVVLVSMRQDADADKKGDILARLSPVETHNVRRTGDLQKLDALLSQKHAATLDDTDIVFEDDEIDIEQL